MARRSGWAETRRDAIEAGKETAPAKDEEYNATSPAGSFPAGTTPEDRVCWVCGGATAYRHCKIICTVCGFTRDCSDP
jgi:hypothetical protein